MKNINIERKTGKLEIVASVLSSAPVNIELFNSFNSFVNVNRYVVPLSPEFNGLPVSTQTQWNRLALTAPADLANIDDGTIGFNDQGGVSFRGNTGVNPIFGGGINTSFANKDTSYRAVLEYLKTNKILLKKCRLAINAGSAPDQFNNEWELFNVNIFGDYQTIENLTPIQYFSPNQVQNNILDIDLNWTIDGFTGIKFALATSVNMLMTFDIEKL